jgi:hypothetical protein
MLEGMGSNGLGGLDGVDPAQARKAGETLIGADKGRPVLDGEGGQPDIVDVVAAKSEADDETGKYHGVTGTRGETAGAGISPQIVFPKTERIRHRHQSQPGERGILSKAASTSSERPMASPAAAGAVSHRRQSSCSLDPLRRAWISTFASGR